MGVLTDYDDEPAVRAPDARLERPRGGRGLRRRRGGDPRRRPRRRTRGRRAHLGPHARHRTCGSDGQPARHGVLRLDCAPCWRERLPEIKLPTLVVHGRRDRFFPVGNAKAIASEIPGARLLVLEEAAMAMPDTAAGTVTEAMLTLG